MQNLLKNVPITNPWIYTYIRTKLNVLLYDLMTPPKRMAPTRNNAILWELHKVLLSLLLLLLLHVHTQTHTHLCTQFPLALSRAAYGRPWSSRTPVFLRFKKSITDKHIHLSLTLWKTHTCSLACSQSYGHYTTKKSDKDRGSDQHCRD